MCAGFAEEAYSYEMIHTTSSTNGFFSPALAICSERERVREGMSASEKETKFARTWTANGTNRVRAQNSSKKATRAEEKT